MDDDLLWKLDNGEMGGKVFTLFSLDDRIHVGFWLWYDE